MIIRRSARIGAIAIAACTFFRSAPSLAQNAYIPSNTNNSVSVIHTATNTVVGLPIPVGRGPNGVAVSADGSRVYVANFSVNTLSVIDVATNTVTATIPVGGGCANNFGALGVAVSPSGKRVYVGNLCTGTVSVIDTKTGTVAATIPAV